MRRLALACAAALLLATAACQTTAPPPPAPVALGPGEWRVTLAAADAAHARLGALREAADLTLVQGGDWFRVIERQGAGARESGAGPGLTADLAWDEDETSARTLDFRIGHGAKPGGPDVYDAHEVAARLGGAIPHPRPAGGSQV